MRILRPLCVAAALSVLAGVACGPPPPPAFTHAQSTAGLRVRITDHFDYLGTGEDEERDEDHRKAIGGAQHALVVRMQEAGYVVVDKAPYDLNTSTSFSLKRHRHQDSHFARARLRLKDKKGEIIDEITLQYGDRAAPASEPDRVAVSLVNEMNKSPKVAAFAQSRPKGSD